MIQEDVRSKRKLLNL